MMIPNSNSCFSHHNIFVDESGDVYSFGRNGFGQCGISNKKTVLTPTKIMNNQNIKYIALGNYTSFILEKNGDLYGCGSNKYSKLGLDVNTKKFETFTFICSDVMKVCSSNHCTVIQKNDRKIFWFGYLLSLDLRSKGQEEIKIDNVASFSCGFDHILFLKDNGEVWAMGSNEKEKCGFLESDKLKVPKLLMSDPNIISVCCGYNFSYILTRDEEGKTILKSFGKNDFGQLGNYKMEPQLKINTIRSIPNISTIHCGSSHILALTDDGNVYVCGNNNFGQMSIGVYHKFPEFAKSKLEDIVLITTCYQHSIFVNKNKEILVCGDGEKGELGTPGKGNKNLIHQLDFKNLRLFQNTELCEWSTKIHHKMGKKFKERTYFFLLCLYTALKNELQIKIPKPIQQLMIKFFC